MAKDHHILNSNSKMNSSFIYLNYKLYLLHVIYDYKYDSKLCTYHPILIHTKSFLQCKETVELLSFNP